jgi:translation initiation factor IF-1
MKTNNDLFLTRQGVVIELINRKKMRVECDNGKIITAGIVNRFRTEKG